MTDEWIADVLKRNPCVKLDNGNVRTCPARISFPNVFKRGKPMEEGQTGKYGVTLLFPPHADLSVLRAEATAVAFAKWPGLQDGSLKLSLHSPFRDQAEKSQFDGYTPGSIFLTANADRQPPCVDTRLAPIVEEARVYPGVWAITTLRCFDFDKKVKKGVSFGLQSIMIIADDNQLGGGGSDPVSDYAGINIDQGVSPASLF
jgi:hypothetical protein